MLEVGALQRAASVADKLFAPVAEPQKEPTVKVRKSKK